MKPGAYTDLPIQAYHADEGYSSSQLKLLLKESPYRFHYEYLREDVEKPDLTKWGNTNRPMCIGGAVAALMDGQQVFDNGYVVMTGADNFSKNSKPFKDSFATITTENPNKTLILNSEYEQAQGIANAVYAHPDPWTRDQLLSLFSAKDMAAECSYYHQDEETGLLVKTRPDISVRRSLLADVKTTSDCGPWAFSKRILDGGHHIQAAMGLHIANHVDQCAITNWMLIVVEQSAPYDVAVYYLDKPTLQLGFKMYRKALTRLADCLRANQWPGKVSGIQAINVPPYALNEG